MQISARQAALTVLEKCRRSGAWSGAAIDNIIKINGLDRREASLASRLALGVLQNSTLCDFYIDRFCTCKLEPKVRDILRLGVYQMLFLDRIPLRAAVNESVSLCRAVRADRASGLVNAVLRKIADNREHLPEIPGKGSSEYLSIKYSHPKWLADRLINEQDYEFAEKFFAENNRPAKLYIQINSLKTDITDYLRLLADSKIDYVYSEDLPGCVELEGGAVLDLPGFDEGCIYVQDKAARAVTAIVSPLPGMNVMDACAAPGGKSFSTAIAMKNCGKILACDIHEKKLTRIRDGAGRLGISIIETACRDARIQSHDFESVFDAVIADVPCSGIGVIGKKPEIRYKRESEIESLPEIQYSIIDSLSTYVKPGGTLLYSTCTVLKSENEDIVCRFLEKHDNFAYEDFTVCSKASVNGMYTFWPHIDGTDGFFAAKLKRMN